MSEINFKDLQEQTGLSLRQLADAMDTNQMVVCRWANGKPPSEEIQIYAKRKLKAYCQKQIRFYQKMNRDIDLVSK